MALPSRTAFTIRFPDYLEDALRRIAARRGISMNAVACLALHEFADSECPPTLEESADQSRAA